MITTDTYPELDPNHATALWQALHEAVASSLSDVAKLAAGSATGEAAMFRFLPPKYAAHYDLGFAQQLTTAIVTVAWKLTEAAHVFTLACTAEEIALEYILATAERLYPSIAGLSRQPEYDDLRETLFEDDAYLRLWKDEPPSSAGDPEDWFVPFRPDEQVHPFSQAQPDQFNALWSNPLALTDVEEPDIEVFLVLGEDWLDVPDNITDQIPGIVEETRRALFPDRSMSDRLAEHDRDRIFQSAAEDVRIMLLAARGDRRAAFDVWLVTPPSAKSPGSRYRLHTGLALDEALDLRRLARGGDYRGAVNLKVAVYPQQHRFDPSLPETKIPPAPTDETLEMDSL